jgi:glycosyltransferase involved in cell wall biosynthesis
VTVTTGSLDQRGTPVPGEIVTARSSKIWLLIDTRSVGGIERHLAILGSSLRQRGIDAQVVLYQDHGPNPWLAQLEQAGVPYRFCPGSLSGLVGALKGERPDLLHTHGYKANILGRVAARATGIRVVSSFHSGEHPPFPLNAYYALDRWTSLLAPRISVSNPIARRLPLASTLVPNYIVVPDHPPVDPLPRRIAFVGRLSEEKAPDLFCELMAASRVDAEWHVFGDGPMRAGLERQYGDRITFNGLVTDMSAVWPRVGLLAMPSRFEGLPMASLEALSHGVPVLASRVGDLATVVVPDRTGWLFDVGDIAAAARAVDTWAALDGAGRATLRSACWQHVRDNFSEQALLPRLLQVYRSAGLSC